MLPTDALFVYVCAQIRDLIAAGSPASRSWPGPEVRSPPAAAPGLLASAVVRRLLGRRNESAFLAEVVARDRHRPLPVPPPSSRRTRSSALP